MSFPTDRRPSSSTHSGGEWLTLAEWDWVQIGNGEMLHAVQHITNGDTVDDDWMGMGFTECGRGGNLFIPGLLSRMNSPRCRKCCAATGMPEGTGSPKNEEPCRLIAQERIDALTASTTEGDPQHG